MNAATPKPGESTSLWLIKIITGPILLLIAVIHVIVNHYIGSLSGLLSYAEIVAYYQNWTIPLMEAVFLISVISHSLIGLRGIVLDLKPSLRLMRALDGLFLVTGLGFTAYGLWLLAVIAGR